MRIERDTFGQAWFTLLSELEVSKVVVSPRGLKCAEITNVNLVVHDARQNLLVNEARRLSYRFAVAEWLWIWYGRDDVKTIAQYNRHIAQFSDNGVDFNGAYGVPVMAQWDYVREVLRRDLDSRQAIITIYKMPRRPTKDVPCTIALQFLIRDGQLNVIATMRSSDIWLGLPYDVFNFSMLGNILAGQLSVPIGSLSLNLGSSHLYASNYEASLDALTKDCDTVTSSRLPGEPPPWLEHVLTDRVPMGLNDHVWSRYARVLLAKTNSDALEILRAR